MGLLNYTYNTLTKKLRRLGYRPKRQGKGSHEIWEDAEETIEFPIPRHGNKQISHGVVSSILKKTQLTPEDLHTI